MVGTSSPTSSSTRPVGPTATIRPSRMATAASRSRSTWPWIWPRRGPPWSRTCTRDEAWTRFRFDRQDRDAGFASCLEVGRTPRLHRGEEVGRRRHSQRLAAQVFQASDGARVCLRGVGLCPRDQVVDEVVGLASRVRVRQRGHDEVDAPGRDRRQQLLEPLIGEHDRHAQHLPDRPCEIDVKADELNGSRLLELHRAKIALTPTVICFFAAIAGGSVIDCARTGAAQPATTARATTGARRACRDRIIDAPWKEKPASAPAPARRAPGRADHSRRPRLRR